MKAALIFTHQKDRYERLAAELSRERYTVEAAETQHHAVALLREARRDVVIAEARRDHFADFLRRLHEIQPDLLIHLFYDNLVFCHYPMGKQPVALLFALDNAGLTFPRMISTQPHDSSAAFMLHA